MNKKAFIKVITAAALLSSSVVPASGAGTSLSDIENSYAKDAILKLVDSGIINGKGNGSFDPTGHISRQDFAIILAKALNLDTNVQTDSPTFSDVPTSHYSYKYVEAAAKAELIKGQGNGTFGLGQNLSRQDMAVLFVRALGVDVAGKGVDLKFSDATLIADYAKDAVAAAVELKLINGNPDGTFNPVGQADRQAVALVASKFITKKEEINNNSTPPTSDENTKPAPEPKPQQQAPSVPAPSSDSGSSSGGRGNPPANNPAPADTAAPVVTLYSLSNVVLGNSVYVASSETGTVYLVPSASNPVQNADLEAWVTAGSARKASVLSANTEISIPTADLQAGSYKVYAVDGAGNRSEATSVIELKNPEIETPQMEAPELSFISADTVQIKYSETLDTQHIPTKDDFNISWGDGDEIEHISLQEDSIFAEGTVVIFHLPFSVDPGATIEVSYSPVLPDNAIRSVSGKLSPAFEAVSVTYLGSGNETPEEEGELSITLVPDAALVMNSGYSESDTSGNTVLSSISTAYYQYDKRNIKDYVKVYRGQQEVTLSYDYTEGQFNVWGDNQSTIIGHVSITSTSPDITITSNQFGYSIHPKESATETTAAELVVQLNDETGTEVDQVMLPIIMDETPPTVTSSTYDNGVITLDFNEDMANISYLSIYIEYSQSGDFTTSHQLAYGTDYTYELINSRQFRITLTDTGRSSLIPSPTGRFRLTHDNFTDLAKNNLSDVIYIEAE